MAFPAGQGAETFDAARRPSHATQPARRRQLVSFAAVLGLLGTLGFGLVVAEPAGAATTLFVSAAGSDTNPCTSTSPCATITRALSLAGSGAATVEVAGSINDNVAVSTIVSIESWPGQPAASVNGQGKGSVFSVSSTGSLSLVGLTVTGGNGTVAGGVDNSNGGTVTVSDSAITGNSADGAGGSGAGGILNAGIATIINSTITDNTAPAGPGAVAMAGGLLNEDAATITNSTITDNTSAGAPVLSGGVINADGFLLVVDSTINGNVSTTSASIGGGGVLDYRGAGVTIFNSTITDNMASGVEVGGGIFNFGGSTATITDGTVTDNTATSPGQVGGGIYNSGSFTIGATIVAGNSANGSVDNCSIDTTDDTGSFMSVGYNLTDDASGTACGFTTTTDKVNANPDLGPLTDNGGATDTLLPAPTSPAVGVIPAPTSLNGLPVCGAGAFDQRGVPRPTPEPNCSTGAVEAAPGTAPRITSARSTVFTAGTDGSFTVTTSGLPPSSVSLSTGIGQSGLPQGVNFTNNGNGTATVSGIATTPGAYSFTIAASNGVSPAAIQAFTLVVQSSLSGGAAMTALPSGTGYWIVHSDGGVFSYGAAPFLGSLPGLGIHVGDIVGIASTPDGHGYWLVGSDGGVFAFGDATYSGSMGGQPLDKPMVAVAATPDGLGYWLVAADGGVFSFGDAAFAGSMGGTPLNRPVVAMSADPAGGYWLVASDGGIFSFGGAPFLGSTGGTPLVAPVVGLTAAPRGTGYWLVAADGGVFAFGGALFAGSLAGSPLPSPAIGLYSTNFGTGYTVVQANGSNRAF